jgi:hypothetical protein
MAVLMVGASSPHLPRMAGVGLGLAVTLMGVILIVFDKRLTRALNAFYGELPGKFQYPRWFVCVLGVIFVTFGVALMALSAALGH